MAKQKKQQQSKRLRDNVAAKSKYRQVAPMYPQGRGRDDERTTLRPQ